MKYIREMEPGNRVSDVYLCKTRNPAVTRAGKSYENVILQDKTGQIDCKIWEPDSEGIGEFGPLDYVDIVGEVTSFNGALQISIKRARKCAEGEYDPADYVPVSARDAEEMMEELKTFVASVGNRYLHRLLTSVFIDDVNFVKRFRTSSAAKSVHHGFVGGLIEHTLSVTRFCDYMAGAYPFLNRDLLISAALLHDIGKTLELSPFPENDYTNDGQFVGHIVRGAMMVDAKARQQADFPVLLRQELVHCILAHHGEYEFGSPKKPAIPEALALNLADNADAKLETFKEVYESVTAPGWQGYNRLFESNVFTTYVEE